MALSFLGHRGEPRMRLEAEEGHRDDTLHQCLPKGRQTGKAEWISDGVPNSPFLLEHKFTAPAGAASFNNLQWYNQIIIFVMVRVLLLSRIIPTEALDSPCILTTQNQFSTAAAQQKFIFLPLVHTTAGARYSRESIT